MIATEMSTVAPAAVENVEHPGMSREQKDTDPTQQLEVDTSDVSIEVCKTIVKLALDASSDSEANIVAVSARSGGLTFEFSNKDARDAALKAMRDYGQIPCVRAAETAPVRYRARIGAIDCVAWVLKGKCPCTDMAAGTYKCPFRHPPPVARVPCRHWIRNRGECWYAEHCNFLHPGTAAYSSSREGVGSTGNRNDGSANGCTVIPSNFSESIPIPQSPVRPHTNPNPWGTSSVIPAAVVSTPTSPRDSGAGDRTIGSPWTRRASTSSGPPQRSSTPDVFGRPLRGMLDTDNTIFGPSSISSADDEVFTGSSRIPANDVPGAGISLPVNASHEFSTHGDTIDASWGSSKSQHTDAGLGSPKQRRSSRLLSSQSVTGDEVSSVPALRQELNERDEELLRMTNLLAAKDQQIAFLTEQLEQLRAAQAAGKN